MDITYILSQVFIVIAYSLFALSYIAENRKAVLMCSSSSLLAEAVGYILLFAWGGLAMVIMAAIRNMLFLGQGKLFEKRPDLQKYEWLSLIIVWVIAIVGAVVTWNGILGTFALVAGAIYTYSIWQKNDKVYDVMGVIACIFLLIYNIFIGSLFGIILEGCLMLWILFVAITGFDIKELKALRKSKK